MVAVADVDLNKIAFRVIRALCLVAEAASVAVIDHPREFCRQFDVRLPSLAAAYLGVLRGEIQAAFGADQVVT